MTTEDDAGAPEALPPEVTSTAPPVDGNALGALVELLLGRNLPEGQLGPEVVPAVVMARPIRLATENVVEHVTVCRAPCPHLPKALARFARSRPAAFRKKTDAVHTVLWSEPEHDLVQWTKRELVKAHPDLAEEVRTTSLLSSGRLAGLLKRLEPDALGTLASLLWATDFAGPDADLAFRVVTVLIEKDGSNGSANVRTNEQEIRELKNSLRAATRAAREAKESNEQAHATIRQNAQTQRTVTRERDVAVQNLRDAESKAHRMSERLKELESEIDRLEKEAEKASRIRTTLRNEQRKMRADAGDLEQQRSRLAWKLGKANQDLERLKLVQASQPSGADAVWSFIRQEHERLENERLILSGQEKIRAEEVVTNVERLRDAFLQVYPQYQQPRKKGIRPKLPLRFRALGGHSEIGMSCYLIEIGASRFLIDCGIKPATRQAMHPNIDSLDRLDGLILTHAHTDHIGWAPALVRKFPKIEIYCSWETAALLPVMLDDGYRHYLRGVERLRELQSYSREPEPVEELYDREDVRGVSELAIGCDWGTRMPMGFGGISIELFRAGHVLGAASVLIEDQSGRRIFASGDFSSFDQLTMLPADWPDVGDVDLLILESTYGGKRHESLRQSREDLVRAIVQTIQAQGSVILACFALGRAQELLKLIALARDLGQLPSEVPVYVDGMINRINPIYRDFGKLELPTSFIEVAGESERVEVATHMAHLRPCIIVTTSGMVNGGPVVEYAKNLLPDKRHRIILTGYQDEGAPGHALADLTRTGGPRRVAIPREDGTLEEFEAAMPAVHIGLSAHADQDGLLQYAARARPRHIVLVHGYPQPQSILKDRLSEAHSSDIWCGPSDLAIP